MKIESVKVEKLFSIGGFNNEKIGFTATVAEGETADQVAGQLFQKIVQIEEVLEMYRGLQDDLQTEGQRLQWKEEERQRFEQEISRTEATLTELREERDPDDPAIPHNKKHLKKLQRRLKQVEEEIAEKTRKIENLNETQAVLKKRIREGDFSLHGLTSYHLKGGLDL